jgi:Tat protein translocase TatB subunit
MRRTTASSSSALGLFEIIIILAVALIVLGPERMPEVVRLVVQILREVRTAANEAMREITEAMEQESPSEETSQQHPPSPPEIQPAPLPDPSPPADPASPADPAPPADKDQA